MNTLLSKSTRYEINQHFRLCNESTLYCMKWINHLLYEMIQNLIKVNEDFISWSVRWLVSWCFDPSQPQRIIYQGWKQTSIYLLVIYPTSHYTISLFVSNHNSNYIHNFGTQTQKNKTTCFWSQIIFRGHSTRERFILRSHTGTGVSHSQHRKNLGEVSGKCRWTDQKNRNQQGRNRWQ